ncbi:hypothetical protein GCM10007928_02630 [Sulfitobacter porphyrae]|nr:hypothetical protein GCM10007928_02630 [Sulfitobacter porphyrae]
MSQIVTGNTRVKTDFRNNSLDVRFRDPETGRYLHLSGAGLTTGTAYAWIGTRKQARTLKERAVARGEDWPFRAVSAGGKEE